MPLRAGARARATQSPPALHPMDQDRSAGAPALHPTDQVLSAGAPARALRDKPSNRRLLSSEAHSPPLRDRPLAAWRMHPDPDPDKAAAPNSANCGGIEIRVG